MRSRKFWVMDYETIVNCFVAVFESYDGDERKVFVIDKHQNDAVEFIKFLIESKKAKDWHFGYNNLAFDAQITEFALANAEEFMDPRADAEAIAYRMYEYAQYVIGKSDRKEFLDYPEFKLSIKCVDIYKLNHWDSNAKRTSLKWTQFSMDWYNVEEMPHPHYERVIDKDTLDMIVKYCINDVMSTKAIFNMKDSKGTKVMASQINLRAKLSETYNVNLYSASEPKISKEIFLHFLSEKLGIDKRVIKEMRTYRKNVVIRDIILPCVKFETPEFIGVHNWFKNLVVDTAILDGTEEELKKKGPKYSMKHKGVPTDYALGGIHGCIRPGVYVPKPGRKIVSVDVTSFYPNLAIKNGWAPAQIPQADFCELYEWFFEERKKYPKSNPLNYLFKIVLNSTYGLSKSRFSFLYDPELTFRITVNGQLLLSMLYEMVTTRIPNSQPLMQNTDGLEFEIDEKDEAYFFEICKEWEDLTQLQLESVEYQKMIIGDVNNYIAVYDDGKTKCKGRFEFEELPLHKNKSNLVVAKAWFEYFVNGVDPKDYIKTNRNIFDYCTGSKIKGDWFFIEKGVEAGDYYERKLQKLVRYFVSKKGTKIIKCHPDGRQIQLESGPIHQTIFNKAEMQSWEDYNIDEKYYLNKIYDEIKKIESESEVIPTNLYQQLKLEL
jgi:hypothetical protein